MKQKFTFLITVFFSLLSSIGVGQTVLKMGTNGGPSGNGPLTTSQTVTLYENGTAGFSTPVTATCSFSNQQYGAGTIEGLPTNTGMSFGGNLAASVNSPMGVSSLYSLMNGIGSPANNMFTACKTGTPGTGIDVTTDRTISLFNCTDALISAATVNQQLLNARIYYGDLTINFNRPVSNPVLQVVGMGGFLSITKSGKNYDMGFATEFDLVGNAVSLSKLSGNTQLNVTATQITNNAAWMGSSSTGAASNGITRYAASGSIVALGNNITSITLKVYVRGDGGRINNGTTVVSPDAGVYPAWSVGSTNPFGLANPNVSGDLMLLGVSLQKPVIVSGNVFNDANGGNVNSTAVVNVVPAGIYANLTDANGKVVAVATVNTDGTYNFPAVFEGTYSIDISTATGVQGADVPAVTLPAGWVSTGEFNGTPNTGIDALINGTSAAFTVAATDISNINFGIERLPQSNNQSFTIPSIPVGTFVTLNGTGTVGSPGPLTGSDPEDYIAGGSLNGKAVAITQLPANSQLWYNGVQVQLGANGTNAVSINNPFAIANYNPALLQVKIVNATLGATSTSFNYAYIDAAGRMDATPATYSINWAVALPVQGLTLSAAGNGTVNSLNWVTFSETNTAYFEVERSFNNSSFEKAGNSIAAAGNTVSTRSYQYNDDISSLQYNGTLYYRVKLYDTNGSFKYSNTIAITNKSVTVKIFPNPFVENVQVTITVKAAGKVELKLNDIAGHTIKTQEQKLSAGMNQLLVTGLAALPKGMYMLEVINPDDNSRTAYKIVK